MTDIYLNQQDVAQCWREQINVVAREREALRQGGGSGGQIVALTRKINAMEHALGKLLSRGVTE